MKRTICILVCALLMLSAAAMAEASVLSVRGTGVVSIEPDTATIDFGVRENSQDVTQAQATVNEKLTKLIEKLGEMGIRQDNIHTSSINIYQDYDYSDSMSSEPRVRYIVENSISVQFDDVENAGKYIDTVFEAGANTFSGINFSAANTEDEKKRALELSVENARKKAEVLAAAAGMRITGIKAIRDEYDGGIYYAKVTNSYEAAEEEADAGYGTPVLSDRIKISASVTIDYIMEPIE